MGKRFLCTLSDGRLAVSSIHEDDPDGFKLAKTMFELSRDGSDMETHFDPVVHTLEAIAAGIPAHFPLLCRECEDTDLPSDRYFRDAWEWED